MNDEYYIVTITEINGEYEYDSKILLVVGKDETVTVDDVLHQYLVDLGGEYEESPFPNGDGYWTRGDGTGYRCDQAPYKLPKQHYDILRRY